MLEVITREKEIRYSSRTRAGTNQFKHVQRLRRAVADLLEQLPEDLKASAEAKLLRSGKAGLTRVFDSPAQRISPDSPRRLQASLRR